MPRSCPLRQHFLQIPHAPCFPLLPKTRKKRFRKTLHSSALEVFGGRKSKRRITAQQPYNQPPSLFLHPQGAPKAASPKISPDYSFAG